MLLAAVEDGNAVFLPFQQGRAVVRGALRIPLRLFPGPVAGSGEFGPAHQSITAKLFSSLAGCEGEQKARATVPSAGTWYYAAAAAAVRASPGNC